MILMQVLYFISDHCPWEWIWNRQKFCKKCIINTNSMPSLDASQNNLSAHFCHSYFSPPRVNSFFSRIQQTPWVMPSQTLNTSSFILHKLIVQRTALWHIFHFCLAELFDLPYVPLLWNWKMLTPWEKSYDKLSLLKKNRDISLPTKAYVVKVIVFPIVMHGCERWTVKKAEHWRIDAFKL